MTLKKYHIYLARLFVSKFIKISIVFFCTVILINFFEEIRFSEKYNTELIYTIYLSMLNAPSLIFEVLPFFIILFKQISDFLLVPKVQILILFTFAILYK